MQPPLLPGETLPRVLRLARRDGLGVLVFAAFFGLSAAVVGDHTRALAWVLMAGAGACELHGLVLLGGGEKRGMNWLEGSQYLFLFVALLYCGLRLAHPDLAELRAALTPDMKASLAQANYDQEDFLHTVYVSTYTSMAGAVLAFKLLVALYYRRRRTAVAAALEAED